MRAPPVRPLFPEEQLLIRELTHRINNEFTSIISFVSLTAARFSNPEVKAALNGIGQAVQNYASVTRALQMPDYSTRIDATAYLSELCFTISRSKLDYLNITLVLAAPPLQMQSDRCWRLGMIVHELITNVARHAFGERGGRIRIELVRMGSFVECRVLDNGSARETPRPGRGLKIVGELAQALGGRFQQQFTSHGSKSIILFPV